MRRWISLILALILTGTPGLPGAAARETAPESWTAIAALETRAEATCGVQSQTVRAAAYADAVEDMIRAVEAAPDYVPGSLERHGSFFFWDTADGRANGYSPSLRAKIRAESAPAGEALEKVLKQTPEQPADRTPGQPAAQTAIPATPDQGGIPENRDVGLFMAYSDSWYFYPEKGLADAQKLADSTGGQVLTWMEEAANVDNLALAIQTCGTLLLNGHGATDYELGDDHVSRANSSYVCLPTDQGFTAADQQAVTGPYGTYRHAFYSGSSPNFDEEYYCVDGVCIANHMTGAAPNSFVLLGCCLGMATEGLFQPLRDRGVEALLGYTQKIAVDADHAYRAAVCERLTWGDSLGQAVTAMKDRVGPADPYLPGPWEARPVLVSDQDPYPGRDNLTQDQSAQSLWQLHPAWPITVTVEPGDTAEVTVTRTRVTVEPHVGYDFADWELTAGTGEGIRTGNELYFKLSGPVSLTLRMEARTPAVLSYETGAGQEAEPFSGYVGDRVTLPAPAGELEADACVYHFLGWSRTPLEEDGVLCPPLLKPGAALELTEPEIRLWAVYGYFAPEDGISGGQFRRLTQAPEDWAGDYVLTYQFTRVLRASHLVKGQGIVSPGAVATEDTGGFFVDGDFLNQVSEELVWSYLPTGTETGLLKMGTSENYLAVPSAAVMLSTVTDPGAAGTGWKLRWEEDTVKITNARFPSRYLQYSPTSAGFCTLTAHRQPLTLYARVPGENFYTTQPQSKTASQPESPFRDVTNSASYYYLPVCWAVNREPPITTGTAPERFGPRQVCTRGQILTFLWRAAGCPAPEDQTCPFGDVPQGYCYEAVCWAAEQGIARGKDAAHFCPEEPCTRGQAVTFLWRWAGCPASAAGARPFRDVSPWSYCGAAVAWAAEQGITTGVEEDRFAPGDPCTRAQIITLLYRMLADSETP